MAKVIKPDELPPDVTYEPPLSIEFGVNSATVGAQNVVMGRTVIPSGQRSQPHQHLNCDASQYVISGTMRVWAGTDPDNLQSYDVPPGYFCFVAQGEYHSMEAISLDEPVVLIFAYGGIPNKDAAGTVFVEKAG